AGGPGGPGAAAEGATADGGAPVVVFADLAGHDGQTVHVGGRIEARDSLRLRVDDGSATAVLRLAGEAEALSPLLVVGHLINAQGVVERTAGGGLEVRVDDPALVAFTPPLSARTGSRVPSGGPSPGPMPPAELTDQAPIVQRSLERDLALVLVLGAMVLVSLGVIFEQRIRRFAASSVAVQRVLTKLTALRAP
ncbi:MAG: hypothetical protein M3253_06475, partial [Chloroflexota bacterium]|nr:hypothetical protein [Chloroflexota bacterium]